MASHIFFLCNLNWEVHSKPSSKSRGSKWEVRLNSPERNRRKFYTIQTGQMQQAEGWPGQEGLSGPKTQGQQQMASKEPARSSESLSQPQFLRGSCAPAPGWQWDSFYWLSCTLNLAPIPHSPPIQLSEHLYRKSATRYMLYSTEGSDLALSILWLGETMPLIRMICQVQNEEKRTNLLRNQRMLF